MRGLLDLALGAYQALRRRRLGLQEGTRDLARAQAAERAQGECHLRRLRDGRMAAGEDQAQPIVVDAGMRRAVDRLLRIAGLGRGHVGRLVGIERAGGAAAQQVERRGCRATVVSQAAGAAGRPSAGQTSSALAKASCIASSASSKSPKRRIRPASRRAPSARQMPSIDRRQHRECSRSPIGPGSCSPQSAIIRTAR